MGLLVDAVGSGCGLVVGASAEIAQRKAQKETLKKGKNAEQRRCIDFLIDIAGCGCGSLNSKMSMSEYQQMVSNKLYGLNLKQRAIYKIGLDASEISEIQPIVLSGYIYEGNDVFIKVSDGEAVSNQFSISWIFFSQTQLYTHTYTFDMISDNTWEYTDDFFYQDITCFKTCQKVVEDIQIVPKGCLKKGESIMKDNFLVDSLEIVVPGTSYSFSMRNNGNLEESIQAAKAMIRERKFLH